MEENVPPDKSFLGNDIEIIDISSSPPSVISSNKLTNLMNLKRQKISENESSDSENKHSSTKKRKTFERMQYFEKNLRN